MRIVNISLLESTFRRERGEIVQDSEEIKFSIEIETHFSDEKKELLVFLATATQSESPFCFSVTYGGKFALDIEEAAHIERIGTVNCPAIIFPFIREHVAELTRRAGLNAFIMNPINFVALASQDREEKEPAPSDAAHDNEKHD